MKDDINTVTLSSTLANEVVSYRRESLLVSRPLADVTGASVTQGGRRRWFLPVLRLDFLPLQRTLYTGSGSRKDAAIEG